MQSKHQLKYQPSTNTNPYRNIRQETLSIQKPVETTEEILDGTTVFKRIQALVLGKTKV